MGRAVRPEPEINMQNFLSAARRDALGAFRLYLYLFFRRRWYKPQGDLGHQTLLLIFPWAMGAIVPWAIFYSILRVFQADGLVSAAVMLSVITFSIWIVYRIYLIFFPENRGGESGHVRGSDVHDLSDRGRE
jgi:hypothetical protein